MHSRLILSVALMLSSASAFAGLPDKPGCTDHPLFPTRMPNYRIENCSVKEFDALSLFVAKGPKRTVEGRVTTITYAVVDRKDEQSGLAVVRNYENALTKIGGTIAASEPQRRMNGSATVDGKEVWVEAERGNGKIWLRIVEKQAMAQHIVADAASFGNDLKATGHTAVYGIFFDTGKSVLKPESTPALEEVAKLLAADLALKLWVVGHTDSVGGADGNMELARARAEAVVTALTAKHGIAAARLKGYGVGPLAPVASNDAEDGRAKNRRVELVKQ
ncbi:MAG: OmpA family protein [Deltaproteobacteria bacterium]|nr:OmpA family protein [Deltaproteobacteria bacterium]